MDSPSDDAAKLQRFYLHWSLKEAYVKAIGQGLGYDLRRISFVPGDWVDCCSRHPQPLHQRQRQGCSCPRFVSPCFSIDAAAAGEKQPSGTSFGDAGGADPHHCCAGGSGGSDASESRADAGQGRRNEGGDGGTEQELAQTQRSRQGGPSEGDSHRSCGGRGGPVDDAARAGGGSGGSCWEQEDRLGCSCGINDVAVEVSFSLVQVRMLAVFAVARTHATFVEVVEVLVRLGRARSRTGVSPPPPATPFCVFLQPNPPTRPIESD